MSHFYGTVRGGRGEAHRCGHKTTGIRVTAKTWGHRIETTMRHDEASGEDYAEVWLIDSRTGKGRPLFNGKLNEDKVPLPDPAFTLAEIERAKDEIDGKTCEVEL